MAELKRRPTSPVYGNLAHDLDALVTERALDEAGRMPQREHQREEETVRRTQSRPQAQPRAQVSPVLTASLAVLAVLVVVLLMGYVKLTAISDSVTGIKTEMDHLDVEHVELLREYEQTFELATVKEMAESAGMSKPSAGQIEYVELAGDDSAVIYAAGKDGVLDKVFASAKEGVLSVVEYFQ